MNRFAAILALITLTGCITEPVVDNTRPPVAKPPRLPEPAATAETEEPAVDPAEARERALILAEVTSYYRDLSASNWDGFAAHFWRGAVVTTIWQPEDGSERRVDFISVPEFIAQMDFGPASTIIFEQRLGSVEVHFDGNVAQVWAHHVVRLGEPGHVREWTDVDAFTLMKHVGLWKISSLALATE